MSNTERLIYHGDYVRIEHFMGTKEGIYWSTEPVREGALNAVHVVIDGEDYTVTARLTHLKSAEEIAAEKAEREKEDKIREVMILVRQFGNSRFNEGAYWERDDYANKREANKSAQESQEEIREKLEELL